MTDPFDPSTAADEEEHETFALQEDVVQQVVDEADTTTFDNRNEFDDPLHDLDSSLTLHGGDATSGHPGLHDLDDVADALGDLFD